MADLPAICVAVPGAAGRIAYSLVFRIGSYKVPRGLVFRFPLTTADGQTWSIVPNCDLDEAARRQIAANVAEIHHGASVVRDVLGAI
jgi:hypothetical protein